MNKMKNLSRLRIFAAIFAMLFTFGSIETMAQKRKPVIRKRTTVVRRTTIAKPAVRYYSVASGQLIRVRLNDSLSSQTARVGDRFTANVTEPVYSTDGVVVIPVGSTLTGRVDTVQAARKGGKPGTIDVSFVEVKTPNGNRRAINGSLTELDTKEGKSDSEGTVSGDRTKHRKLIFIGGGGAGGAVLGGAFGGGKGALIGAIIGGVGGAIAENQTKGENVDVKSGTEFGVFLNQAITLPKYSEPIQ